MDPKGIEDKLSREKKLGEKTSVPAYFVNAIQVD